MDRILIILKKENDPRASSAPALGLNTIRPKKKMLCFRFHHKFSIGSVGRLFFFFLGKSGSVGIFFFFFFFFY